MKRILILGPSGSGKTTLAEKIGKSINIPIIHLDRYFWNPVWTENPQSDWVVKVKKLISGESWVMDGNFISNFALRSKAADTIIFIKVSLRISYFRTLRRIFK
jgi:adenylate kinase family enzyme